MLTVNGTDYDHQALEGVTVIKRKPFKRRNRKQVISQLLFHEPAGDNADETEAHLRAKGYGTQLHITEHAELRQNNDLRLDVTSHAGHDANERSIGIEVQNPYYPTASGNAPAPWQDVIKARWAHKLEGRQRLYVVPSLAQLKLCVQLCEALTDVSLDGVEIPRRFPALSSKGLRMGACPNAWSEPGILSHMVSGVHADGSFIVLVCYLALECGLSVEDARARAMVLAVNAVAGVNGL